MAILELRDDRNGAELYRLLKLHQPPGYVKSASLEELRAVPREPAACADPTHRRYDCSSRAATWLSAAYFHEKSGEFNPTDRESIKQSLRKFAEYWDVLDDVDRVERRAEELRKEAAAPPPDEDFALPATRELLLRDAAQVKEAAAALEARRDSLSYDDRRLASERVLEKAGRFGAALTEGEAEFLEKQAGRGVCDPSAVVEDVRRRARVCRLKSAEVADGLEKLAENLDKGRKRWFWPENQVKLARLLDELDRNENLTPHYGGYLKRPEDLLFEFTLTKSASLCEEHCELVTGSVYPMSALTKLALDDVRSVLGDEIADSMAGTLGGLDPEKMAEVLPTLPRPDARLLESVLDELGARPVLSKKAELRNAAMGLTEEELLRLSEELTSPK